MTTPPTMTVLDREECLRLLAANSFGRLAINFHAEVPMIRPVNYLFDERSQSIIFRTDFGSKLQGVIVSSRAAFEIDGVDHVRRTGWSVIVSGTVERVANQLELDRFAKLDLRPYGPGPKPHWARIRVWTVSGRRITSGEGDAGIYFD
jgi:nitroimidazol reductase NimA-like FMN-containing flavoprotein (pyridoxamine 5'-phosphate oxidase superfamily)